MTKPVSESSAFAIVSVGLFLLCFLLIPPLLFSPFGRDQGIFAWQALSLLKGGLPYVASWDVKGPAVPFTYAALYALFGVHEWSIRLLDFGLMSGTLALVYHFLKRQRGEVSAILGCFLLIATANLSYWELSQPDIWGGWLLMICVVLVLDPAERWVWGRFFVSGLVVGWMLLVKLPYFLLAFPFAGLALHRRGLLGFLGGLLIVPLFVFVQYANAGALDKVWEVFVIFNLQTHAMLRVPFFGLETFKSGIDATSVIANWSSYLLVVLTLPALRQMGATHKSEALFLGALWGCLLSIVCVQGKYFPYHFVPLFMVGSLALSWSSVMMPRLLACLVCVSLIALKTVVMQLGWWVDFVNNGDVASWRNAVICGDFRRPDINDAALHIQQESKPEDMLYLWGFDAFLYVQSNRLPPTRLGISYPMMSGHASYEAQTRAELMAALVAHPPKIIAVQKNDRSPLLPLSSAEFLQTFSELSRMIADLYQPFYENTSFRLYRHKDLMPKGDR